MGQKEYIDCVPTPPPPSMVDYAAGFKIMFS